MASCDCHVTIINESHTHTQDIAIFTNDASRCSYYQQESANVKSRFACVLPEGYINENINQRRTARIPNERKACEVCGGEEELSGNMKELGLLAAVRSRVISSSYTCVYLFPLGSSL